MENNNVKMAISEVKRKLSLNLIVSKNLIKESTKVGAKIIKNKQNERTK